MSVTKSNRKNVDAVYVWRHHYDESGRRVERLERQPVRRSHRRYRKLLVPLSTPGGRDGQSAANSTLALLKYFGEKPKYICRLEHYMLFGVSDYCASCLDDCGLIETTDEIRMSTKLRARKYPAYVLDADTALTVGDFMNNGGRYYAGDA